MKKMKNVFVMFLAVTALVLTSCSKEDKDKDKVSSLVKVKVIRLGAPVTEKTVCMFGAQKRPDTSFFEPLFADKKVVTDGNGVATFELQEIFDLEAIDTQTTLYFGVFEGKNTLLGKTSLTIKKGETREVSITIN